MDILKSHGLKSTKNRIYLYNKLKEASAPLTAQELKNSLPKSNRMNLATIYRNLNSFVDANIAERNIRQDGVAYFSLHTGVHTHYLVCEKCGRQFPLEKCPIDFELLNSIKSKDFQITGHALEISGICKDCQNS